MAQRFGLHRSRQVEVYHLLQMLIGGSSEANWMPPLPDQDINLIERVHCLVDEVMQGLSVVDVAGHYQGTT